MNIKRTLLSLLLTLLLSFSVTAAALPASALSPGGAAASVSLAKTTANATVMKSIANTTSGVKLTWNKKSGAAKYKVYRKSGNSSWKAIGTVTGTSYTDKTVKSGTTYTYTVQALKKNNSKVGTYDRTGKKIRYVAAPKLKAATANSNGITVTWYKSAGAAKYRVFRKSGNSGWKGIGTVSGTSYTDKSVKAGTTYTYTVRCVTSNGKSYTSAYNSKGVSARAKGGSSGTLSTPTLKSAIVNNSSVTVSWNKVSGAAKYRVFRKTGSSGWKSIATVSGTSYADKNIKVGTTYKYTVRCLSSNGKSYTSGYDTKGITAAVLKAPTVSSLSADNSGIKITWSKVSGAAKYRVFRKTNGGSWQGIATVNGTSYTDTTGKAGNTYTYTIRCMTSSNVYTSGYNTTGKTIKLAASHTHSWTVGVSIPATCTSQGKTTYTCSCGATKTETTPVNSNAHSCVSKTTPATCTTAGQTVTTCTACGKIVSQTIIPATGHEWNSGTVTKAPTCTEQGSKTCTCQTCGTTKTEAIAATGHTEVPEHKDATTTSTGYDRVVCSVCGKTISETVLPVIVDKSSLQSVYNEASELLNNATLELYRTTQSWSTMKTAANNAQSLLNSNTATQTQVDSAASALRSAIDGLESYTYSDGTLTYYEAQSKQILAQINEYRVEKGLNALTWSNMFTLKCLSQAAYNAIAYGIDYEAYIDNSWDPAYHMGDTIGCALISNPNEVLDFFKNSPTHNANILESRSNLDYAGVAYCSYKINGRSVTVCIVAYGTKNLDYYTKEQAIDYISYLGVKMFNSKPLTYYGCTYEDIYNKVF